MVSSASAQPTLIMSPTRSLPLCLATTRYKEPCQNRSLPNHDFCYIPEHRYQVEEARSHTNLDNEEGQAGSRASATPSQSPVYQLLNTLQADVVTLRTWEEFTSVVSRRLKSLEDGRRATWQSEQHPNPEVMMAYISRTAELAQAHSRQESQRMHDHLSHRISEQLRAAADRVAEKNRRFLASATDSLKAEGRTARTELERIVEEKLQRALAQRPHVRDAATATATGEVEIRDGVSIAAVVQGFRHELKVMIEEEVASRRLTKQLEPLDGPSNANDPDHRRHTIAHEGYSSSSLSEMAKKNQRKALEEAAKRG